jgi:hypothetical protein
MSDLQESPATPPVDFGGDQRVGMLIAGALLLVLGWGFGLLVNAALHWSAPSGGSMFWTVRIYPHWGTYAIGVGILGLFTGAFGAAMVVLSRQEPKGPLVLPGYAYSE